MFPEQLFQTENSLDFINLPQNVQQRSFLMCLRLEDYNFVCSEAATGGVYTKDVLKISQNSQENTCARVSFLTKLQAWGLQLTQFWLKLMERSYYLLVLTKRKMKSRFFLGGGYTAYKLNFSER